MTLQLEENFEWRVRGYVKLWALLQTDRMLDPTGAIHLAYMCRRTRHRSLVWCMIEQIILSFFGFKVWYRNVCWWTQRNTRCQRKDYPNKCPKCGLAMDGFSSGIDETSGRLLEAAAEEFCEVLLSLEALAAS